MAIDWQTFWLTLQLAFAVSVLLLFLGLPIAYWIAFSRWRWKFLVQAVVALPLVLPRPFWDFMCWWLSGHGVR